MSNTIWKYVLPTQVESTLNMPAGAKIIHCNTQHGAICLWAEVNPAAAEDEKRTFQIVGTGFQELTRDMEYLGTVMTENKNFVWHIYEIKGVKSDEGN